MAMSNRGLGFGSALGAEGAYEADRKRREAEGATESDFAARASEIQMRIAAGVYDAPGMAEEVARRLLAAGDLDVDPLPASPGGARPQGSLGL